MFEISGFTFEDIYTHILERYETGKESFPCS